MTTVFPYAPGHIAELRRTLSEERFGRYLEAVRGDKIRALSLHVWNTAMAAAFYGPLQACEVALRNNIHGELSSAYGRWWLRDKALLRGDELRMARDAELVVARRGKEVVPGRVVAELGFGFWVGLFAKAYDQALWRTHLYRAFSPRPDRRQLHDDLDRLRTLRNRIAHHEPIFHRNLVRDHQRIVEIVGVLSPPLAAWVAHHSRVYDVVGTPHAEVACF